MIIVAVILVYDSYELTLIVPLIEEFAFVNMMSLTGDRASN
jgi:hypothetical protein